jgi:hypothetical protein
MNQWATLFTLGSVHSIKSRHNLLSYEKDFTMGKHMAFVIKLIMNHLPCPSPSNGEAKSIAGLKAPAAIAALAKCWAPTIFPLQ